jgi:hypothetical protein
MVRRCCGGRRHGARGRGATPPVASMPYGSNPQEEEQVIKQEHIFVGNVVGLMRSFQRMSEALINRLDRDEARVVVPNEGSQRAPAGSGSIHIEIEKVKFSEFMGVTNRSVAEAWLENMAMCFALHEIHLQHEGLHGSLLFEGELSSMVEDAPTSTKHGHQRRVMGTVRGAVPREVYFRGIH